MIRIRLSTDPGECRSLWQQVWPQTCLFDLWQVRKIFADSFYRTPFFLLAEENGTPIGMLALSFLDELNQYAFFPGELWQNKTWVEQNRIPAVHTSLRDDLLAAVPAEAALRYLTADSEPVDGSTFVVDEENFRFHPRRYDFSFDKYMLEFSGKSRKNFTREMEKLGAWGITFRHDHLADIDQMLEMNLAVLGEYSYFADQRFYRAFAHLCAWLAEQKMLRITTLLLGGRIAAVDVGAVWRGQYTVLAGGTNREFPGVAKIINFHHLDWACTRRLEVVDFLCGDFNWKRRFHLQSSPLYKLHIHRPAASNVLSAVDGLYVSC